MRKSEQLARQWMPGFRQGPGHRPAWMHPQDLVNLLLEMKAAIPFTLGAYDEVIYDHLVDVAWAHDLLEDGRKSDGSRVTKADLLTEGLSADVVADVVALSQQDGEEKPAYLARLRGASAFAMIVKCVDRICNLREGKDTFKSKRWARYVQETTDYILPLVQNISKFEAEWLEPRLLQARDTRSAEEPNS